MKTTRDPRKRILIVPGVPKAHDILRVCDLFAWRRGYRSEWESWETEATAERG